jgi:hypothetical protein
VGFNAPKANISTTLQIHEGEHQDDVAQIYSWSDRWAIAYYVCPAAKESQRELRTFKNELSCLHHGITE